MQFIVDIRNIYVYIIYIYILYNHIYIYVNVCLYMICTW